MKSNRMFGILCKLLENEKVTAKELADYFEVSVRTIHRDLLDLSSAGFPVVTLQGVGGGVSLLDNFRYSKAALNKDEMNLIFSGLNGLTTIDDSANIKTLLAKLRLGTDKMLLENDIIIDFSTWNYNSVLIAKIKKIRKAIAVKTLIEMRYYSGKGYSQKSVEPYKLIFKKENWYLFGFCTSQNDFRIYKLNRIAEINLTDIHFEERSGYEIPELKSDFVNSSGQAITVRMDSSLEFLAIDFFGIENINKDGNKNIIVTFQTENTDWVIGLFAEFGEKAEILSPDYLRNTMRNFLEKAIKQYET